MTGVAMRGQRFSDGCKAAFTWRGALVLVLLAAAGSLGLVLIAQYGFGFKPCVLCLWQRIPYLIILTVAPIGILPQMRHWVGAVLLLCALLLMVESGIAMFHVGVEQHWWLGTTGCSIQATEAPPGDIKSLREELLSTPVAHCDEITWTLLGLSMATWNVAFALGLALYAFYVVFMGRRNDAEKTAK